MLPGWSGNNNPIDEKTGRPSYPLSMEKISIRCGYKGCDRMAVYGRLPGSKLIACKDHGAKVIARLAAAREDRRWR